jgi:phosphonate transport system substrate-binding protein
MINMDAIKKILTLLFLVILIPVSGQPKEKDWPDKVRIVYLPFAGEAKSLDLFDPWTKHLEKELGVPVEGVSFDSYERTIAYLAKGEFEIAYLSPAMYASASSMTKLSVIAMELDAAGNPGYRSLMISRKDSGIKYPKDIKGKTLAFTEVDSTSGFQVPLTFFLMDLNTTPAQFAGKVVFAGSHANVVKGVMDGTYDVGATNDMDLGRIAAETTAEGAGLQIVWVSELIPGAPICTKAGLPESFKKRTLSAFLKLNEKKEMLSTMKSGGFMPATEKDYLVIKKLQLVKK